MARIKRPKRFHTLSGGKPQMEGADMITPKAMTKKKRA